MVLHGPAGVGKTRLAEEALRRAERGGRRSSAPSATRRWRRSRSARSLTSCRRRWSAALGVGDDERTGLFHAARAELRRMAGDDRLVLLVDDLDLLDETSVAVLVPLVVSRTVFLIGTVRTGRTPVAAARRSPTRRSPRAPRPRPARARRARRAAAPRPRPSGGRRRPRRAGAAVGRQPAGAHRAGARRPRAGRCSSTRMATWVLTGPCRRRRRSTSWSTSTSPASTPRASRCSNCWRCASGSASPTSSAAYGLGHARGAGGRPASSWWSTRDAGRPCAWPTRSTARCCGRAGAAAAPPHPARAGRHRRGHGARRREDVVQVALWRVASGGRVPGERLLRAARLALAGHDPQLAMRLVAAWPTPTSRRSTAPRCSPRRTPCSGGTTTSSASSPRCGTRSSATPRRAHLAKRLAEDPVLPQRDLAGALAAHEAAARCCPTTTCSPPSTPVGRCCSPTPAGRPRRCAIIEAMSSSDARQARGSSWPAATAVSLLSVGRHDEAERMSPGAPPPTTPTLPGWLARRGITRHLVNEAHALAYSGRYAEATRRCSSRRRAGAGERCPRRLGVVRDDPGRDRPRHRPWRRGDPPVRRGRRRRRRRPARTPPSCGPTSASPRATCCSASATRRRRPSPAPTTSATARSPRRWPPRNGPGPGSTPAAATWRPHAQRIREAVVPIRADELHMFEPALLHDLVRFGVAGEAVDRLEELGGVDRRPAGRGPRRPRPRPSSPATPTRCATVVDGYEALDVLDLAAEAAAELAELHQQRGEARLATAAMQRCAELADAGRRPAHAAARPWRRRRAADRSRARGGAARRRRAQQPGDRRPPGSVDPNRRDAPRPRVPQAGHHRPLGARRRRSRGDR